MERPIQAHAETTGPARPPRAERGTFAPVPRALRIASAALSLSAVAASALVLVAELWEVNGRTAVPAASLLATTLLAAIGVPLLFAGPLGKYLGARERRLALAAALLLPAVCWGMAAWPAIAAVLGWS